MNIDDLTLGEIKEIREEATRLGLKQKQINGLIGNNKCEIPVEIGKAYLFRTVTHIEVGRVKSVHGVFITLENASWIADTGRYHNCLSEGVFNEVEPYPDTTIINSSSLINFAPWNHELPTEQK